MDADDATQLYGFVQWAYRKAFINVDQYFKDTVSGAQGKLFTDNKMDQPKDRTDDNKDYYDMVIGRNANFIPQKDTLQIGDILCYRYKRPTTETEKENVYLIALYQGNDRFLLHEIATKTGVGTTTVKSYEEILETKDAPYAWSAWFVLRPENVAFAS